MPNRCVYCLRQLLSIPKYAKGNLAYKHEYGSDYKKCQNAHHSQARETQENNHKQPPKSVQAIFGTTIKIFRIDILEILQIINLQSEIIWRRGRIRAHEGKTRSRTALCSRTAFLV